MFNKASFFGTKILLNLMIAMEDFLEKNDIYAYKNWIYGEVVGTKMKRYSAVFKLMYPYNKMPDPNGAKRLFFKNVNVKYKKTYQDFYYKPVNNGEVNSLSGIGFTNKTALYQTPKPVKTQLYWLIEIEIPLKYISDCFIFNEK